MHLKHVLRQIQTDYGNFRHDRPPMWIVASLGTSMPSGGGHSIIAYPPFIKTPSRDRCYFVMLLYWNIPATEDLTLNHHTVD
jgi:hypothetical protein